MNYRLFIDDIREPPSSDWIVARTSTEAIALIERDGCPREISFDHDLGGDDTAMRLAHWLVSRDLDEPGFIPFDFRYYVHSANPVGRANIDGLMSEYLRHKLTADAAKEE